MIAAAGIITMAVISTANTKGGTIARITATTTDPTMGIMDVTAAIERRIKQCRD